MIVVSLITKKPSNATIGKYFGVQKS